MMEIDSVDEKRMKEWEGYERHPNTLTHEQYWLKKNYIHFCFLVSFFHLFHSFGLICFLACPSALIWSINFVGTRQQCTYHRNAELNRTSRQYKWRGVCDYMEWQRLWKGGGRRTSKVHWQIIIEIQWILVDQMLQYLDDLKPLPTESHCVDVYREADDEHRIRSIFSFIVTFQRTIAFGIVALPSIFNVWPRESHSQYFLFIFLYLSRISTVFPAPTAFNPNIIYIRIVW